MPKRKMTNPEPGRQIKRAKTSMTRSQTFTWKPVDWKLKRAIANNVSVLVSRTDSKQLIVKKVLGINRRSNGDPQPIEIRALSALPDCNRIVRHIFYSPSDPDFEHGTALFEYYPLGDLAEWKARDFDRKNHKPVPESFIWRFFVQMSQALAFIHNHIGPDHDQRACLLNRDVKPKNILVVDNGKTYPSFKLHDFDCAVEYRKSRANRASRCGTFQWQPPENPIINTIAAEIWALGACVHFLAVGHAPIQDQREYTVARFNEKNAHPRSADEYSSPTRYYGARVPRQAIPINISKEEQRKQGVGPANPLYSNELNEWMMQCLSWDPKKRPTTDQLICSMRLVAENMLRRMGGKPALADLDAKFGADA